MFKTLGAGKRTYHNPQDVVKTIDRKMLAGVNILFINMPIRPGSPPNCLPLGCALLAARLQTYGADPHILDLNAYRVEGGHIPLAEAEKLILARIQAHGVPVLVALSGIITTLRWQMDIARIVRSLLPDVFIVSGNGLATEMGEVLFDWIPELDAVARAEGDYSIVKVAHDAAAIKKFGWDSAFERGLLDPYYYCKVSGRNRFSYDGGRPQNLDDVPAPAYELLEDVIETYLVNPIWGKGTDNRSAGDVNMTRSINTVSSRGCPFDCSFCFRDTTGNRRYSVRSAESMLKEFCHYHKKYKVDFVGLLDDNFMVSRDRIIKMAPIFKKFTEITGVRWGTHGRLDEAADLVPDSTGGSHYNSPLRVELMAEAGCVYIGFGAESANKEILEAMGKGGFILSNGYERVRGRKFPRTMTEGIRNTKAAGIQANLTWIMGYPGETLNQLKDSVAFVQWQSEIYPMYTNGLDEVNKKFFVATAYPGTRMFSHPMVREKLKDNFGINFDEGGLPLCDENLKKYVLELDDATKVMSGKDGRPLNFSGMPDDIFIKAKSLTDSGRTFEILEM